MKVYVAYVGVAEDYDHQDFSNQIKVFASYKDAKSFIKAELDTELCHNNSPHHYIIEREVEEPNRDMIDTIISKVVTEGNLTDTLKDHSGSGVPTDSIICFSENKVEVFKQFDSDWGGYYEAPISILTPEEQEFVKNN